MSENKEVIATEETVQHSKPASGKLGLAVIFILVLALAGAAGFGLYQLNQAHLSLTRTLMEVKQQTVTSQQDLQAVKQALSDLQKSAAESKQQSEQKPWPVAEAYYLTRLAGHYLQLTHDAQKAYLLLQSASDVLQQVPGSAVDALRQSLANDIASLQSASPATTEQLYLALATIYNQLDNLPLPPAPLQASTSETEKSQDNSNLPWWKLQWHKSMDALQKIVIVRYTGATDLPLVMPEERMFLYQNLHAQMEEAMLGLLQQNTGVYQVSLVRLTAWIKKYFVQDAPLTVNILQQLQDLQTAKLQPPAVNLSATLQLFDQFLGQNQSNPVQPAATL